MNNNTKNKNNTDYAFIFKIILIGNSNTGKTSLINRYVNNSFDENYHCTIGVDFMMKRITASDTDIKLQIWDTAGMEKYKQITTSYYRGAQSAVIVFDLTNHNSFETIKKWIDDFLMICNPNINPIIAIVGNKCDLSERTVTKEEIDRFLKGNTNYTYIETSAKDGNNVDSLFIGIAKELLKKYRSTQLKNNTTTSNIDSEKGVEIKISESFHNLINKERKSNTCC